MAKSNNQKAKILYLEKMLRGKQGVSVIIARRRSLRILRNRNPVQSEKAFMMMWRYYVLLEWISVRQENRWVGIILPGAECRRGTAV